MGPGGGFKPPPSHARVALVPLMIFHSYCCISTGTERTETSANTTASCFSASIVPRSRFLVSGCCFWSKSSYTEPDNPNSTRLNICFTQIYRKETSTDQMEMLVQWRKKSSLIVFSPIHFTDIACTKEFKPFHKPIKIKFVPCKQCKLIIFRAPFCASPPHWSKRIVMYVSPLTRDGSL